MKRYKNLINIISHSKSCEFAPNDAEEQLREFR